MLGKRLMAVDLGTKRVGVALTDPLNIITQPYKTIIFSDKKQLAKDLNEIIKEKNVGLLVFGIPKTLSDKDSQKTLETKKLIEDLRPLLEEIEIDFQDEALTTTEAHEAMRAMGKKPSKNRDLVDQIAAQFILKDYKNRTKR
ncbi:MAG: Holliday junction resolvase RuvX [Candidatus Sericytochromatia bacterium]